MKSVIYRVLFWLHVWQRRIHTHWRVSRTGIQFRSRLDYAEKEHFLNLRPALFGEDLVIYDIGAASGKVSSCLAKLPNVRAVHAFEPLPSAFNVMVKRVGQYPIVTVHNVAVGDVNREMEMIEMEEIQEASSLLRMNELHKEEYPYVSYKEHTEQVAVVCLDDYVNDRQLPQPDVIKIDVQGYEDRVLRGGRRTTQRARYCVIEMSLRSLYDGSPLFDDVYQQMRDMGFRLVGVTDEFYGKSGRQLQVDGIFMNETRERDDEPA